MAEQVILFDIENVHGVCSSPNSWRTRLVLNYKSIPYKTEWVEYPDLAPKFKSLGIPPNPAGEFADYTSPTVRLSDGTFIMRSLDIAQELEKCYPTPSLHLDQNLHQTAEEIETKNIYAVAPDFLFNAWKDWVNPDAKDWYAKDRAARFGMPLQVLAEKAGGEQCLPASNAALEQLKQFLKEHKRDDGPFILGSTLSYGDFVIVALLEALSRIAKGHFEIMLDYDDSIRALYNACRPWAKRDD